MKRFWNWLRERDDPEALMAQVVNQQSILLRALAVRDGGNVFVRFTEINADHGSIHCRPEPDGVRIIAGPCEVPECAVHGAEEPTHA